MFEKINVIYNYSQLNDSNYFDTVLIESDKSWTSESTTYRLDLLSQHL